MSGHTPLKQKLLVEEDERSTSNPMASSFKPGTPVMASSRAPSINVGLSSSLGGHPPVQQRGKVKDKRNSRKMSRKTLLSLTAEQQKKVSKEMMNALRPDLQEFGQQVKEEGYGWDLVLVMPSGDKVREAEARADELGVVYMSPNEIVHSLVNAGLQVYLYYGKPDTPGGSVDTIFCKVRAPLGRLEAAAQAMEYMVGLDPEELSLIGRRGVINPATGAYMIEPMDINENPDISTYSPYNYIFAAFSRDPRLETLWLKAGGQRHPWSALHRIKIIMHIIKDPSEAGCGLELEKLLQTTVLAYYPPIDKSRIAWLDNNFFSAPLKDQPVDDLKEYLGEKIGLYFVFLGHYTQWLWYLSLAGLVVCLDIIISAGIYNDMATALGKPYTGVVFAIFASFWSQFMIEYWKRTSARKAMEWGMAGFEDKQDERAAFALDPKCENIHSPVNGKPMVYFPTEERAKRARLSMLIIGGLIVLVLAVVSVVFEIKYLMASSNDSTTAGMAGTVASIFNALQIQVLNAVYGDFAAKLNDYENHRTETEYEDSLIVKLFCFTFVNSYAPLFYIAFVKEYIGDSCEGSCMSELAQTVVIIFGTSVAVKNFGDMWPLVVARVKKCFGIRTEVDIAALRNTQKGPAEKEFELEAYDTSTELIDDYAELSIQYGYVTMFVTACPIAPLLAYYSNVYEIKLDGGHVLHQYRRPIPQSCEDIGTWQDIFQILSFIACITNAGIMCFTMDIIVSEPSVKIWLFIAFQYAVFSIMSFFDYMIDDVPHEVTVQLQRQEFLVSKVVDLDLSDDDEEEANSFSIAVPKIAQEDDDLVIAARIVGPNAGDGMV